MTNDGCGRDDEYGQINSIEEYIRYFCIIECKLRLDCN